MQVHDHAVVVTLTIRDLYLIKAGLVHYPMRNKLDGVQLLVDQIDDIISHVNGAEI